MVKTKYVSQDKMNMIMSGRLSEIFMSGEQGEQYALYSDDPSAYVCITLIEKLDNGKWLIERW